MKWSPQQDNALIAAKAFLRSDENLFRLFGYAGTGKTTLAKELAKDAGNVLFAAYTGKAAHVLQQKGCSGASTIHSLIYNSHDKSQKQLKQLEEQLVQLFNELRKEGVPENLLEDHRRVRDLRKEIEAERKRLTQPSFSLNPESPVRGADLVIIDECSMVDGRMGEDLLSFGTKVLVLGDPAQLPPIGSYGFFTDAKPNVMLDEIHRQAEEDPIIRLASMVRQEQMPDFGEYGPRSRIIRPNQVEREMATDADQILVGRNATRFDYNRRIRKLRGIEDPYPVTGDRIVCLRNDHDVGLLNGAIWIVEDVKGVMDHKVLMTIRPEDGGEVLEVLAHEHYFLGTDKDLNWFEKKEAQEFDFGYALTVHKSQGSQWNDVYLNDESFCFRQDKWRWLYTGITRAAQGVTIVRG